MKCFMNEMTPVVNANNKKTKIVKEIVTEPRDFPISCEDDISSLFIWFNSPIQCFELVARIQSWNEHGQRLDLKIENLAT